MKIRCVVALRVPCAGLAKDVAGTADGGRFANDFGQVAIQRMFRVRPIESLIAIAPADNQFGAF